MESEESTSPETVDKNVDHSKRRVLLKALGFGAIAVIGATGMYPTVAMSQPIDPNMPGAATAKLNKELVIKLNRSQLRELTITKRLPSTTPITQMGLDPKGLDVLTPAARELTKSDLEALGAGQIKGRLAKLSVEDVKSIKVAFAGHYNPGLAAADVSCCCCTPCCCAAAVNDPLRKAA